MIRYRETFEPEMPEIDPYVAGILGAGVFISVVVWALAIAKIIDLFGFV